MLGQIVKLGTLLVHLLVIIMKMVASAYVKYGLSQFHYCWPLIFPFRRIAIIMHFSLNFVSILVQNTDESVFLEDLYTY